MDYSKELREKHGLCMESVPGYIVSMFVVLLFAAAVSLAVQILVDKYLPVRFYAEYEAITTEFDQYAYGTEKINVESYSLWKKNNLNVEWRDELFCKNNQGSWDGVGSQMWWGVRNKQNNIEIPARWPFRVKLPEYKTECKITSVIQLDLKYGRKVLKHESNVFRVAEKTAAY